MTYVILDLEWNGAYCDKLGGYFNEIIEIGAVRLSEDKRIEDRLDAYICPVVSRKLTRLVTNLTGITDDQVRGGVSFGQAMERLCRFIGDDAVVMTWSNTDLTVLMENCRYFYGDERIPFLSAYVDLQHYAQQRLELGTAQQVALGKLAEQLHLGSEEMELHHAIDDSVLAAAIFRQVYEPTSFQKETAAVDDEFYRRLTFKPTFIREIDDPLIRRADLRFSCDLCQRNLKRVGKWQSQHRFFTATFRCASCGTEYIGRVQAKKKYDGVEIKKRLIRKTADKEREG